VTVSPGIPDVAVRWTAGAAAGADVGLVAGAVVGDVTGVVV